MAALIPLMCVAMGMTVPLSGTVVDAGGHQVAGASVWLGDTIANRQGPEVLASAQTDDRGRFRLDRDDDLAGRVGMWSPTLWAYKPGFRVGFLEFKGKIPGADEPVRIALGPPASTALRVLLPDGKPAEGVSVRVVQLNIKAPRPPDKLLDRFAATTDADGRATARRTRAADILWVDVTAPGSSSSASRPIRMTAPSRCCRSAGSRPGSSPTTRRPFGAGRSPPGCGRPRRAIEARTRPTGSARRPATTAGSSSSRSPRGRSSGRSSPRKDRTTS